MLDCLEESVEGMACVYGGAFPRGSDEEHACDQGENSRYGTGWGPQTEVWVQTFYMDQVEVTYGAYQACVAAGDCTPAKPSYQDYNRENQPMVGMSWFQAKQFCEAQGKILPSEAQWQKAARGEQGLSTPFQGVAEVSCEQAVIMDGTGRSCGVTKDKGGHPEKGRTWEVGLKPAGVYDIYDMVGNAEEWVADWYSKDFTECGEACLGTDPKGPCGGAADCAGHDKKMVMGGSWYWPAEHAHGWHRRPHFPANKPYHHFGFRCAAAVEQADAMGAAPVEAHPPAE